MGNFWLKIKIWTKTIFFGALAVYGLLFIFKNSGQSVRFWYWFKPEYETSMLVLIAATFFAGVIGTLAARMTFKTIKQIRELKQRNRLATLERETAEMKAKAAMLQTRSTSVSPNDQTPV